MSIRTRRGTSRWTNWIREGCALLSVAAIAAATLMVGGVAFAPAAQACPDGCTEQFVHLPGGRGEFCSAQGVTSTFGWLGASRMVNYGSGVSCEFDTLAEATKAVQDIVDGNKDAAVPDGYTEGACQFTCRDATATVPGGSAPYCSVSGQSTSYTWDGATVTHTYGPFLAEAGLTSDAVRCQFAANEEGLAMAASESEAAGQAASNQGRAYAQLTVGVCTAGLTYSATGSAGTSVDFCTVGGTTEVVTYAGTGSATSTVSQEDANYKAQQIADAAALADLTAKTPAGATLGACGAPVLPATVAPVQAATVAAPAPAKVTVPAAATTPETVPAGDGSSVPTLPVWALALLVLGTVTLTATATRLAVTRSR